MPRRFQDRQICSLCLTWLPLDALPPSRTWYRRCHRVDARRRRREAGIRPRGRQPLTEDIVSTHERLAQEGVRIIDACRAVGWTSPGTYYYWSNVGALAEEGSLPHRFFHRVVGVREQLPRASRRLNSETGETV
jgi:hypothetical protein